MKKLSYNEKELDSTISAFKQVTKHLAAYSMRKDLITLAEMGLEKLKSFRNILTNLSNLLLRQEADYQNLQLRSQEIIYKLFLKLLLMGTTREEIYHIFSCPTELLEGKLRSKVSTYKDAKITPSNCSAHEMYLLIEKLEIEEQSVQMNLSKNLRKERNTIDKYLNPKTNVI